jgi:hypothetical protein
MSSKAFSDRTFGSTEEYESSYWAQPGSDDGPKKTKKQRMSRDQAAPTPLMNATVDGLGFYTLGDDTLVWYQVRGAQR